MFKCESCGSDNGFNYDYKTKRFTCANCNIVEQKIAIKKRCYNCGNEYDEYTWFDPSGCNKCHKTFVD